MSGRGNGIRFAGVEVLAAMSWRLGVHSLDRIILQRQRRGWLRRLWAWLG